MTDLDRARDLITRFLRTYESGDLDALWAFYADDCRFPVLERFGLDPTRERYRHFMADFLVAFPDVHHEIENLLAQGDDVWALYTVTATHLGPLRGAEPTGRSVRYQIVAMYRVVDGLIASADFIAEDPFG